MGTIGKIYATGRGLLGRTLVGKQPAARKNALKANLEPVELFDFRCRVKLRCINLAANLLCMGVSEGAKYLLEEFAAQKTAGDKVYAANFIADTFEYLPIYAAKKVSEKPDLQKGLCEVFTLYISHEGRKEHKLLSAKRLGKVMRSWEEGTISQLIEKSRMESDKAAEILWQIDSSKWSKITKHLEDKEFVNEIYLALEAIEKQENMFYRFFHF